MTLRKHKQDEHPGGSRKNIAKNVKSEVDLGLRSSQKKEQVDSVNSSVETSDTGTRGQRRSALLFKEKMAEIKQREIGRKKYSCKLCSKVFVQYPTATRHVLANHPGKNPKATILCPADEEEKKGISKNKRKEVNRKKGQKMSGEGSEKENKKATTKDNKKEDKSSPKKGKKSGSKEDFSTVVIKMEPKDAEEEKQLGRGHRQHHKCPHCVCSFKSENSLTVHLYMKHADIAEATMRKYVKVEEGNCMYLRLREGEDVDLRKIKEEGENSDVEYVPSEEEFFEGESKVKAIICLFFSFFLFSLFLHLPSGLPFLKINQSDIKFHICVVTFSNFLPYILFNQFWCKLFTR